MPRLISRAARSTPATRTPCPARYRARPAPWLPLPSTPARATTPDFPSQHSRLAYPAAVAANSPVPGSPPRGSSAAATCTPRSGCPPRR